MSHGTYKPRHTVPEILRLKSEGLTNTQIAERFRICDSTVSQIVRKEAKRVLSVERSNALRSEIKSGNDIDRRLGIDDLLCVLNLTQLGQAVLRRHFDGQGIRDFSLRDMMDFLIPKSDGSAEFYDHMSAYRVRGLGKILYGAMIRAMSLMDCGEAFRAEWVARKQSLSAYLEATGDFSMYVLHGRPSLI